jgi:hypothetical protein
MIFLGFGESLNKQDRPQTEDGLFIHESQKNSSQFQFSVCSRQFAVFSKQYAVCWRQSQYQN